jgi:hypothetical protein
MVRMFPKLPFKRRGYASVKYLSGIGNLATKELEQKSEIYVIIRSRRKER